MYSAKLCIRKDIHTVALVHTVHVVRTVHTAHTAHAVHTVRAYRADLIQGRTYLQACMVLI